MNIKIMNQHTDGTDQQSLKFHQDEVKIKKRTVISIVFGILLYFADVISDISVAVNFYNNGHKTFFCLTLFLVVLSAAVSSILSFVMYHWLNSTDEKCKVSKKVWTLRAFFLLFGIAPVLRGLDALYFAWKSNCSKNVANKIYYANRMASEITDNFSLKLYEAFIESGPQLILQMYIFAETQSQNPNTFGGTEMCQCVAMFTSAISISSAVVAYSSNSLKNTFNYKTELKLFLLMLLFLWRFFEISSRIIAMSLGISATPYLHVVFFVHFIIICVCIYIATPDYHHCCDWKKIGYLLLQSVIFLFVFFKQEYRQTVKRLFYGAMFVENTAIMIFWIYFSSPPLSLKLPAAITQTSSFCLSILFMVIYDKYFSRIVKLSKKRTQENNLKVPETAVQNKETCTMLELVGNEKKTEI